MKGQILFQLLWQPEVVDRDQHGLNPRARHLEAKALLFEVPLPIALLSREAARLLFELEYESLEGTAVSRAVGAALDVPVAGGQIDHIRDSATNTFRFELSCDRFTAMPAVRHCPKPIKPRVLREVQLAPSEERSLLVVLLLPHCLINQGSETAFSRKADGAF